MRSPCWRGPAPGNAVELSVDRAALEALSGQPVARRFGGGGAP